jgi:hypothetical protein
MHTIIHADPPPRKAGKGRDVDFHGSFKSKADAQAKERSIPGAYIEEKRVKGQGRRYLVLVRHR